MATQVAQTTPRKHAFGKHYLEMVLVMMISMASLGAIMRMLIGVAGGGDLYDSNTFRACVMTFNMTLGMTLWMRYRRHGWRPTIDMGISMVLPIVLLIGPYLAGAFSTGVLFAAMHLLMLPFMWVAMLRHRHEYSGHHR